MHHHLFILDKWITPIILNIEVKKFLSQNLKWKSLSFSPFFDQGDKFNFII